MSDNPVTKPDPLDTAFSSAQLMNRHFPPLEYVVPGVIPEGLTMLVAPPKIGKSWMVLGLAKACSEGSAAFDALEVDQRPVLYLALEDGERRLQDRLATLGMSEGNSDLTFMVDIPAGAILTIGAFIERNADRKPLVILDTLGKVRNVFTGNDTYQKDYAEMSALKTMVDNHPGSSLIVVHHTNKGAHGDFVSSVSGTQGITGAADSVLTIERSRSENEATLNVTSRDAAEGSYAIALNDGAWVLNGADLTEAANTVQTRKATSGVGDDMTRLIEQISKHPEGITAPNVATQLHWKTDKARTYLNRAYNDGRIQRLGRGKYAPYNTVITDISVTPPAPNDTQITQITRLSPEEAS